MVKWRHNAKEVMIVGAREGIQGKVKYAFYEHVHSCDTQLDLCRRISIDVILFMNLKSYPTTDHMRAHILEGKISFRGRKQSLVRRVLDLDPTTMDKWPLDLKCLSDV